MSDTTVTVTIYEDRLARLLTNGGYQMMLRLGNRVLNGAKVRCPVDTGNLQSSGEITANPGPPEVEVEVAFRAEYAIYVHEGTRYMAGRPFLADALTEEMSRL